MCMDVSLLICNRCIHVYSGTTAQRSRKKIVLNGRVRYGLYLALRPYAIFSWINKYVFEALKFLKPEMHDFERKDKFGVKKKVILYFTKIVFIGLPCKIFFVYSYVSEYSMRFLLFFREKNWFFCGVFLSSVVNFIYFTKNILPNCDQNKTTTQSLKLNASHVSSNYRLVGFLFVLAQKCPILNRSARFVRETIPSGLLKAW